MLSLAKNPVALESLGNDPGGELNDATLTRIIQDLYSQFPKEIPDLGQSNAGVPEQTSESLPNFAEPLTHGLLQPTKPEMKPMVEFGELSIPGAPPVNGAPGMPDAEGPMKGVGGGASLPSPHSPEMMAPSPSLNKMGNDEDSDSKSEPGESGSFNPYFIDFTGIEQSTGAFDGSKVPLTPGLQSLPVGGKGFVDPASVKQIPDSGTYPSSASADRSDGAGMPPGMSNAPPDTTGFELDFSKLGSPFKPLNMSPFLSETGSQEALLSKPMSGMPQTEGSQQDSFSPYFMPALPNGVLGGTPAGMPVSGASPSDPNQLGALQSPHASEAALKGTRNGDGMTGLKQSPQGMESGAPSAQGAESGGVLSDQLNLSKLSHESSTLPYFMFPVGSDQPGTLPSLNDTSSYLDVKNLKRITERFSFDVPRVFPGEDPVSTTIREKMDPKKDHPIAEGIARTLIKPFAPTFDTNISSYSNKKGDAQAESSESSDDGNYPIKNDFPALKQNVHGKPLIWLDSAATSQKPYDVIEKVKEYYHRDNSNVHRGAHTLAARSTNAYEEAREKVQAFIKAESKKEIVFVRGATEGINLVAQSWGRKNIGKGDEILLTEMEHHSNIVPWQFLAQEKGARIKVAPFTDVGEIDLEVFGKLLNEKTKIVAFTHVSNSLGTINPVKQMTGMAHQFGAKVLVDACQSVPHMPVKVHDINCDFLVFSGHKLYAPTGIGVLFGKRELLETMPPWQGGGSMIVDVTFDRTVFADIPAKFEAGTGNIADAVGLGAAIDYLNKVGMENVERFEQELIKYGMAALSAIPGLRLIGTAPNKAGVIAFLIEGYDPVQIGTFLDHEGIAVRAGHHCAQPAVRHYGVEATVRPSLGIYNTKSDIDALVKALHKAIKALK